MWIILICNFTILLYGVIRKDFCMQWCKYQFSGASTTCRSSTLFHHFPPRFAFDRQGGSKHQSCGLHVQKKNFLGVFIIHQFYKVKVKRNSLYLTIFKTPHMCDVIKPR